MATTLIAVRTSRTHWQRHIGLPRETGPLDPSQGVASSGFDYGGGPFHLDDRVASTTSPYGDTTEAYRVTQLTTSITFTGLPVSVRKSYRWSVWVKAEVAHRAARLPGRPCLPQLTVRLAEATADTRTARLTAPAPEDCHRKGHVYDIAPDADEWHLVVGYVHSTNTKCTRSRGGVYRRDGHQVADLHDCIQHPKTPAAIGTLAHQSLRFDGFRHVATHNAVLLLYPRFEELDGREMTVPELLSGYGYAYLDTDATPRVDHDPATQATTLSEVTHILSDATSLAIPDTLVMRDATATIRTQQIYADTVISTSDRRLKTDVRTEGLGLPFVLRLRPVSYRRRGHDSSAGRECGFLAQDVRRALHDCDADWSGHTVAPDGTQCLRYATFVMPLVNAVQELHRRVRQMERVRSVAHRQPLAYVRVLVVGGGATVLGVCLGAYLFPPVSTLLLEGACA